MSIPPRAAVLAAILVLPAVSLAQPAPKSPTPDQIAHWIKELGDNDFEVREAASKKLWEAGEAAEAAVLEAAKNGDAEVVRRAGELTDKFRWGIYPNTTPKVLQLITRYQGADENGRLALVREMFDAGAAGCATLLKIARVEKDANFRRRLFGQIGEEASRAVPALLAEGSFNNLETLLELGVTADADSAMPSYAAYWLLRGRLDDAVTRWKAETAKPDNKRAWEVLTYLNRAKGDLAAARAAAEKTDRPDLVEEVLYQQSDWKALAKRPTTNEYRRHVEALGYKAAYQRLAGDGAAFDATVGELRKYGESRPEGDVEVWYAAKALFLNDRPAEALALLAKKNYRPEVRLEVLAAQGRYREAFDAADALRLKPNDPQKVLLDVLRARTLYHVGETDKAQAIFVRLAGEIQDGNETLWQERLVEVEYRLGLRDQARDHCAKVLAASKSPARVTLLDRVFPGRGDDAAALWPILRKIPGKADNLPDPMKQLRDLFDGKATEKEITELAAAVEKWQGQTTPEERDARLLALATAASAAKQEGLARSFLERARAGGSASALLRLGDHLAANKEWEAAAGYYAQAWAKDANDPLPLFLRGHALVRAGKEKEGALWMERARLLPLGNEPVRHAFADALAQRGHREEAGRERDLLVRLSQPGSFYAGDALRQMALDAAGPDPLKAADLHERAMLRALDVRISFQDSGAYVAVPGAIHRLRMRGLIAAGRLDEARKQIALCEAALPDDVEMPCLAVGALEKADRKKEADELFNRCRELHEAQCRDYPNSAHEHNALAWLSVCCRRDLAKAQNHAEKAVSLAPQSAGYQDTLSEVFFQRGDKVKALAAARRCAELEPGVEYYKRQIKRIEAGDPKAPLPPQGD